MVNVFDIAPNDLIKRAAEELKQNATVKPPVWASYVKTGVDKQRPPYDQDWWYIRCASLLRYILKRGPVGVCKLRTKYGGKKNRGTRPEKFFRASGSVIRKALQQLEKAGYVKQAEKGVHKGRVISPQGKSFLDKIALSITKLQPTKKINKKENKEEATKPEVNANAKENKQETKNTVDHKKEK